MAECLRRVCPCAERLWRRIATEKRSPGGGVGAGGGEAEGSELAPGPGALRPVASEPGAPESGSIYTATWAFEARHRNELSFQEGDLFRVLSRSGDWWTARRVDRTGRVLDSGIVPHNYLVRAESLKIQPWFFGRMNRLEAQSQLMGTGNEEGSFLIRQSEKDDVGYVLSVRASSQKVKHYKIHQSDDGSFNVDAARHFPSLLELVDHYGSNNLVNTGRLGSHCRRKKPETPDLNHFTVDEWELPKAEFSLEEELGSGYFADVYRGRWKQQVHVAVKILKSDSELNHREFQREVQILKSLRHRHLISLFAVCTDSTPYYIITELMERGSLLSFLRGSEGALQDPAALVDMGAQVADGMSYLEEKNSIHRDLAARNVLVGGDYVCKVADFGLARVVKEPFYVSEDKKIPYKWSAPEAVSHGKFSIKSDVWSFGILLYEIITRGGVPYPALSNQEVFQKVTRGYRMEAPPTCPDFLYEIMLKCWREEPSNRPQFNSLRLQLDSSSYEMC